VQFTLLAQICRRGEDLYNQLFHHRFTKKIEALGPIGGTVCSFVLLNSGKVNKCNRNEWTCHAPHADPLRDATGWHGFLWMYRHFVKNEPLPDFDDWGTLSTRSTFCNTNIIEKQSGDRFFGVWKKVYLAFGLCIKKVTHHWKGQGVRDMTDAGILPIDVAMFTGTQSGQVQVTQALLDSYMYNPPIRCVHQRAGGIPGDARMHCPAYSRVDVPDELLLYLPGMEELLSKRDILMQINATVRSRRERDEIRIETRLGCLQAFLHDIKRALLVSAARPVDPISFLTQHELPAIQATERYRNGLLSGVFALPIFESKEFMDLRDRVRDAEDAALSTLRQSNTACEFANEVVKALNSQQIQFNEMTNELKARTRETCSLRHDDNCNQHRIPMPIQAVAAVTHTKAGAPRQRCLSTPAEHIRLAEMQNETSRPRLKGSDDHCQSMEDHWRLYTCEWLPLKMKYGPQWNEDETVMRDDGTKFDPDAMRSWWYCREPLYEYIEKKIESGKSESDAISDAQIIYNSLERTGRTKKPAIKALGKAFRAFMEPKTKGRGKKSKSSSCKKAIEKTRVATPATPVLTMAEHHNVYQFRCAPPRIVTHTHDGGGAAQLAYYQIHSPYGMHTNLGVSRRYPVPIVDGQRLFHRTSPTQYATSSPYAPGASVGGNAPQLKVSPDNVHWHPI
jgi:hypothetical protein